MMLLKKILSLITFFFITGFSNAQQIKSEIAGNGYRVVHWGVEEGLGKERWHNAIIKDVNGFIWFGSNHGEISRFDGSAFKHYYSDKNKSGTIRNEHCIAIIEDSLHNLWMGTFKGLSRYDIKADTFTNFPVHVNSITLDESVIPFWTTRNEVFCIEAGNQIISYDIHSFKRKKLIDIKLSDKVGLVQFALSTGRTNFHRQIQYLNKPDTWGHTDAEAMCFDKRRDCIWINSHDGLTQFTLSDQQFHHIEELNPFINVKGYARMVGIDIDLTHLITQRYRIVQYNRKSVWVT